MILTLFLGMILLAGCGNSENISEKRGVIIPAYFYDNGLWEKVIEADNSINYLVIVNPNSGPGDSVDDHYINIIEELVLNDKKPIGYIYTKWGSRNIDDVNNDIDKWIEFYPQIKGFFLDEATTNEGNLSYYADVSSYIKSKGDYFITLNPGAVPIANYFSFADNIVVYEGDYFDLDENACVSYADKSSIIVYNVDETNLLDLINSKKCISVYFTDDSNSNDSLPSYFDKEIEYLK
jgi:hypothetical protein